MEEEEQEGHDHRRKLQSQPQQSIVCNLRNTPGIQTDHWYPSYDRRTITFHYGDPLGVSLSSR